MKEKNKEELFETGKFYLINNRYDEALKIFESLLEEDKNDVEVLYHIGLVKEAKNELKEAKDIFLKVLELQPKHKLAKKHLDKLLGISDEQHK
ncbi:MAG: tetratricopeptide repeat protein [Elusimicrobiota bacterium]|nr:tetratricopeptide repeat protein [Endomicrobiia bacterium]MCX7910073.1 tetratricopeptide repeat protein [Endomicrobiia bacterium]MDW8165960.1 tetratricopeptide repeat protein [Elusimicrobiota bacterium]